MRTPTVVGTIVLALAVPACGGGDAEWRPDAQEVQDREPMPASP